MLNGLRYLGLGTWATGNPDTQAIGSCVCMYVCMYVFWVLGLRYLGDDGKSGHTELCMPGMCFCVILREFLCEFFVCVGLRYLGLGTWATTGNPGTQGYVCQVCVFVCVFVCWA